jgi:steroid delta-isomerase
LLPLRQLQYDPALITSGYLADYRMFGALLRGPRLGLIAVALAISPAAAQSPDPAQAEIRAALLRWTADFNARNSRGICDLFAPDLRYDYRGQPERGYRDICDLLQKSLSDPSKHYNYSAEIKEIIVSADLAVVRLVWTLSANNEGTSDAIVSKETGLDVFRREPSGGWKIIRYVAYDDAK